MELVLDGLPWEDIRVVCFASEMKRRGWLNLRSFLATQLWNLRGGKIYLRLQIQFLTKVLGLIKRKASLEAAVGMRGR